MRLTIRGAVRQIVGQQRALRGQPFGTQWWLVRQRVQLLLYEFWCQWRGRDYRRPLCPHTHSQSGSQNGARATKQMSGFGLPFFGRTLWLVVPVVLEREPSRQHVKGHHTAG